MKLKVEDKILLFKQLGVAALYLLFGALIHHYIIDQGIVSIFWPGSGLALAAVIVGGRRYLWGVLLGALILNVLSSTSPWIWVGLTLVNVLEAYLALWLLTRNEAKFTFNSLRNYLRLIGFGALSSLVAALLAGCFLLLASFITSANYFAIALDWWMGDILGIILLTPFILSYNDTNISRTFLKKPLETVILLVITALVGQIVFLGWLNDYFNNFQTSYFVFLLVVWIAIRLDIFLTTAAIVILAIQGLVGAYLALGTFGSDIVGSSLQNCWNFIIILSGVGVVLSTYVNEVKLKELKLKSSEARLKEAQLISKLGNWELNIIANKLYWSDEIFSLFEIDSKKFTATYEGFLHAIHPEDRHLVNEAYQRSLITREPYEITHRLLMEDGRIKWVVERGSSFFNNMGEPIRSVGTVQDVTLHYLAELEIHSKDEQLRAFYELDLVGLAITSPDKGLIRINDYLCKMLEYSEQELLTMTWVQLTHPDDLDADVNEFTQLLANKINGYSLEKRYISRSGKVIPTQLVVRCTRNTNNEVDFIVAMVSDISDKRHAEAQLRLAATTFETSEAIMITDADANIIRVNKAFEVVTGYTEAEVLGKNPRILSSGQHDKSFYDAMWQSLNATGTWSGEVLDKHKSGKIYPKQITITAVKNSQNMTTQFVAIFANILQRKLAENAIRKNQQQLLEMLENSPIAVCIALAGRNVRFANNRYAQLIDSPSDQVIGKCPKDYYANPQAYEGILAQLNHGLSVTDQVVELKVSGSSSTWAIASYLLVEYENEPAVLGWFYDITALKVAQESLRISEEQAKTSLEELKYQKFALDKHAIVAVTDIRGRITYANQKFCEISGYNHEELLGQDHSMLNSGYHPRGFFKEMYRIVVKGGVWHDEVCNRAKDGHLYWVDTTIAPYMGDDGKPHSYISIRTDITQRKLAEEKSNYLALYDTLTQLPNRRLLMDRLNQALISSARSGRSGALLFLDLDNFKSLNDTLGHDVGDMLLQQVAQRLTSCMREIDTVARLGGDEFVVLIEDMSDQLIETAEYVEKVGKKILTLLRQSFLLGSYEYTSTSSIGATLFKAQDLSMDELLKQADIAMYQAKQSGRNALRFFDPQMQASISARVDLENDLRKAVDAKQMQLYYQVQVDSTGKPLGAEALIRWIHPERGMISPLHFIPLAEETGLILPIGKWVLETGCAQIKLWQQNPKTRNFLLSINVSAKQFLQADFVSQVQEMIMRYDINPARLKLELTESMLVHNVDDIIKTMNKLAEIGVRFSLDDFGTGYSSLQYLKKLPLHQLKIDQSFIRDIASDASDKALVRTIIAMARSLSLNVIAEGVETEAQRLFLLENDCLHYQGYLFGRPLPIAEFELLVEKI